MKRLGYLLTALALVPAGCDGRAARPAPADDAEERAAQRKEEYRRELRAQVDKIQSDLAELRLRAETAGEEARERMRPHIESLRAQARALDDRLEKLKDDTAAAWRAAEPELDRAVENLRDAFRKAADQFRR